ncbi:hypothetical protein [Conexibacter sp. CPCC 206217]|uniref:hypothetical protein n=1 Tax=Conexibacter sp. CPCC 206217 TaxID=3064574 RepID=UPI00272054B4|nr:hypothetical protein [Conexibacter sp. CPCC 206217]MDO8210269.1 hypothetical protein [Conexibacter sp. CPCC 206217]
MPTRLAILLTALFSALVLTVAAGSASAAAPPPRLKSCKSVSGRAGGVDQIRLTKTFACPDARQNIGSWLTFVDSRGPRPWTCTHRGASVSYWRCHLRTSFGGTRPLRLYRLNFRLLDA